jgi:hypothetical protein
MHVYGMARQKVQNKHADHNNLLLNTLCLHPKGALSVILLLLPTRPAKPC